MASKNRPVRLHWKKSGPNAKRPSATHQQRVVRAESVKKPWPDLPPITSRGEDDTHTQDASKMATLRDLCPQDKLRVRQLVEQLAAASEERERLEVAIETDRQQFSTLLDKLKIEHQKVLEEKQRVVQELHSSQLQLQQLHTYPTLPHNLSPSVQSHNSHMIAPIPIMTPSTYTSSAGLPTPTAPLSNRNSPPTTQSNKSANERGCTNITHTTTTISTPSPPISSMSAPNKGGFRGVTPQSDDWQTLPSHSPQIKDMKTAAVCVSTTQDHMLSNLKTNVPGHMTCTTSQLSSAAGHMTSTTQSPASHMTTTMATTVLTPPVSLNPSSHSGSRIVTHSKPVCVSGQPKTSPRVTTRQRSAVGSLSTGHTSTSTQQPATHTLRSTSSQTTQIEQSHNQLTIRTTPTNAHPTQNIPQRKNTLEQNHTEQQHSNHIKLSHTVNSTLDQHQDTIGSNISPQMESLLTSALLNAQQTLHAIQTLSSSVGQDTSVLVAGSNHTSLVCGSVARGNTLDKEVCSSDDSGLNINKASPVNKQITHSEFRLSSPDRELVMSLNSQQSGTISANKSLLVSHSMDRSTKKNEVSYPSNNHQWHSSTKTISHTPKSKPPSIKQSFSQKEISLIQAGLPSRDGLAVTSTPCMSWRRNRAAGSRLEARLGSNHNESEDEFFYISDILEHAQSLSQKLHSDNYSMPYSRGNNSDQSEPSNDDEIINELFFI